MELVKLSNNLYQYGDFNIAAKYNKEAKSHEYTIYKDGIVPVLAPQKTILTLKRALPDLIAGIIQNYSVVIEPEPEVPAIAQESFSKPVCDALSVTIAETVDERSDIIKALDTHLDEARKDMHSEACKLAYQALRQALDKDLFNTQKAIHAFEL
jgi:hypothetical protein